MVWQKSNETGFLLTMSLILFTNQGYPLQNSSLGQLHSDGGIVSIVRSSAGRLLPEYLSARQLRSKHNSMHTGLVECSKYNSVHTGLVECSKYNSMHTGLIRR